MQCGTRTGLILTRSRSSLVLVLTGSQQLSVLVLSCSRYTLVLAMTWPRLVHLVHEYNTAGMADTI